MKRILILLTLLLTLPGLALATENLATETQTAKPRVQFDTSMGKIVVELEAEKAPHTVTNFLRYVEDSYYNNTIFHRVIAGFMVQGGGFTPELDRKLTRTPIINEANNGLANKTGTIAMARTSHPHSASAQFFFNVADNDFLNHTDTTARGWGYAVFGRVVQGMDVVMRISNVTTGPSGPFPGDVPQTPVVVNKVTLLQ